MIDKKAQLIKELENIHKSREVTATILYLKHDVYSDKDYQNYPMLQTAIDNFESLYKEYIAT